MRRFQPSSLVLSVLFALSFTLQADAASLTLAWDAPEEETAAGYIVRYGTVAGVYTSQIDVGDVTTSAVSGLADSTTYFFVVQAYDEDGLVSEHSNQVSGTTPPAPGSILPPAGGTPTPSGPVTPGGGSTADGLTANFRSNRYIDIAWLPAPGSPDGYRVEVGTAYGDTALSAMTRDHALTFDMTDLPAAAYFMRVRPVFGAKYGYQSEELSVKPPTTIPPSDTVKPGTAAVQCVAAPRAPRQLGASANAPAVALNWQMNAGEAPTGFVLQVGSAPGLQNVLVTEFAAKVNGVTATASNAAYALRLAAVNGCGASLWGPETMLYVGVAPLPGMPRGVTRTVSGGLVTLTWAPPTTGGKVTRYLIEAATPVGPFVYDTGNPGTGFANANTPPGHYVVTVRAGNATGFGPASAPIQVVVR
jgi:hypothetical protein